ncbi:Predicted metal-dependent phosphohydrolase, HD superfamily [Andreprevotia lacus DSM 23236]|jgi:predicted metal-dependent HD superfamily phosphohydrolase|uniref:Predicted metal-dependent phosphohydrolase, HD superfamily n=1 Tax=Andreprevotia lacus DSM 23236 TaxID=1121001 RepID=A0A1W1XWL2_9NEIS|nr:N-methyl-D-aspartate receptor NMDAR2C subunit [Andreprevotia lacus]SMC28267.1 Predicted metal-dependent phosphohydrolase, HD superfamily [Andreprevotia lacus DSM 23236]
MMNDASAGLDWQGAWQQAWADLSVPTPDAALRDTLLQRYAEPQRHYHTQQHLAECLSHFAATRDLAQRPGEVALALWFHDAVYAVRGQDNEQQSADWARAVVLAAGVDAAAAERIHALIMATCHRATPQAPDAQLLVDIDLAILGADEARFAEYEQQIRREYRWVPGLLYRLKRREVLASFASRPRIFSTDYFFSRLEATARANLQRALA